MPTTADLIQLIQNADCPTTSKDFLHFQTNIDSLNPFENPVILRQTRVDNFTYSEILSMPDKQRELLIFLKQSCFPRKNAPSSYNYPNIYMGPKGIFYIAGGIYSGTVTEPSTSFNALKAHFRIQVPNTNLKDFLPKQEINQTFGLVGITDLGNAVQFAAHGNLWPQSPDFGRLYLGHIPY